MEIILNEEQLKTILNEEVMNLIKEAEETKLMFLEKQKEIEIQETKKQISKVIKSEFSFYSYFDDYVNEEDYKVDGYSYVAWKNYGIIWKMYLDLILKFGKELVDEVIVGFIKEQEKLKQEDEMD